MFTTQSSVFSTTFSKKFAGAWEFGFNAKENIEEVKGWQDYGFRMYDNRIGRPPSIDPLYKSFPELSPYQFFSNSPIMNIDLDGKEGTTYAIPSSQSIITLPNVTSVSQGYSNLLGLAMIFYEDISKTAKDYYRSTPEYKHQQKQNEARRRVIEEKRIAHGKFVKEHFGKPDNEKYINISSIAGKLTAATLGALELYKENIEKYNETNEALKKQNEAIKNIIKNTKEEGEVESMKKKIDRNDWEIEVNNKVIDTLKKEKTEVEKSISKPTK